jgi:hypothetical protein
LYEPPPLGAQEESAPVVRLAALQDLPRSGRPPDFSPSSPVSRKFISGILGAMSTLVR